MKLNAGDKDTTSEKSDAERKIRLAFWICGALLGVLLAYTNRFFLNTDGLIYIEMGEGLKLGEPGKLINLACSPLYAVMLGLLQVLFNPSPLTELPLLKIAGVINLLCAMVAADMLIRRVRREFDPKFRESDPEAWLLSIAAMYALFLIAALVWVKVRLVNPDMLALCFVILSAYYVVRISQEPGSTRNFALLGVTLGLGYLTKTYIFPFSPVFLAAAYMAGGGRSAWRKTALAAIVLLAVSAPLLVGLSAQVGRFSFGEAANLAYTTEVAGRGEPVYKPLTLYSDPNALYYDYKPMCTDAMGFDIARWSIGLKPNLNLRDQAQAAWRNLGELFSHTAAFFLLTAAWLAALGSAHLAAAPKLRPPGIGALLMGIGMCGIGLFVPVHLEMRYIAPFVFLTILGALVFPRYQAAERAGGVHRPVLAVGAAMILFMVGMLLYGAFDQSVRGFRSIEGKLSFQQAFEEFVRLKSFLEMRGIQPGDHVALIGGRPLYWARMSRVRVMVRIPDQERFLSADPTARSAALDAAKAVGIKAVIGKGSGFAPLSREGWFRAPGAGDFYVKFM